MPDAPTDCPSLVQLESVLGEGFTDDAVSGHLRDCEQCQDQLEEIRRNHALMDQLRRSGVLDEFQAGPAGSPHHTHATSELMIADYEVIREHHRGGQGVVYLARQLATNREVALKVLLAGPYSTSKQRRRFEREIDLAARLRHPNIVTVYDSGRTTDDRHWLALEYIDGRPLDQHLDAQLSEQPTSSQQRRLLCSMLTLVSKTAAAVHYAHQRGVLHRDLKPPNILVDEGEEPRVLDFGLAKLVDPDDDQHKVTVEDGFLGTLAYAAPEQTTGDQSLLDVRCDVYALGVILYELLTGELPYALQGSLSEALRVIQEQQQRPPSEAHPSRFPIDADLDAVTLRALAKDPDRRYQSAAELQADIERYLNREPVEARRDSTWYVVRKALARHRIRVLAAASLLVLLITFGSAMSVLYQRARQETMKTRQINIFLEDTLGSAQQPADGRELTVRELLDEGVLWIDLVLQDQPEIEAEVRGIVGNGYRNLGMYADAEVQLRRSLQLRRVTAGDNSLAAAKGLGMLALLQSDRKRFDEAIELLNQALRIQEARLGDRSLTVAQTLANMGQVHRAAGDRAEARSLHNRALDIRLQRLGERHTDCAMSLYNLGSVDFELGDPVAARKSHERALATRREILQSDHPDLVRSLLALSRVHIALNEKPQAEALLRECAALCADSDDTKRSFLPELELLLQQCRTPSD